MTTPNNPFKKLESKKPFSLRDLDLYKQKLEALLEMKVDSEKDLLLFFDSRDELDKLFATESSEALFLKAIDTSNDEYRKNNDYFEQTVTPVHTEYQEKLNKKVLASPVLGDLGEKYQVLKQDLSSQNELYSKDNLELEKQINKLSSEITEIQGSLTAEWDGEKLPLTMIYPHMESSDRETRKKAFQANDQAILSVFEIVDQKFDQLITLRHRVAKNAGFERYSDYRFKQMKRFEWDQTDCYKFHDAVKKHVVPLAVKLAEQKKVNLGLDTFKYYDRRVDFQGQDPHFIYDKKNLGPLIEGTGKIIKAIDEELFSYFKTIRDNELLDLDARENKANVGFMCQYPTYEMATVFYGGSGLSDDLMVLLHELGHCFHYFMSKDIKPYSLQEWTPEVAEGGSMSMEYIGLENMDKYLSTKDCERVKSAKLRSVIGLFTMCSLGDEFQHWIYENPNHTSQERQTKYKALLTEYNSHIDYDGQLEMIAKIDWQYYHILHAPFYMIDYCISELLALSIWDRYKKDPEDGLKHYKQGCALGASKPVSEIYKAFGTKLNFSEEVIAPLAKRLKVELDL